MLPSLSCCPFPCNRDCEHALEGHKETFHFEFRKIGTRQLRRAFQFLLMKIGLAPLISSEGRQASVGCAIGVAHQEDTARAMQANRHSQLLENKVALEVDSPASHAP